VAQELAGDAARVEFPAPDGGDPAFWKPDPAVISRYQQADLVLLNGANYARWLAQVSMPGNRLLDTSAGFADQIIVESNAPLHSPLHSHGPEGDHSHGEAAFTTWLDLSLLALQAEAVAAALEELLPDNAAAIGQRLAALQQLLSALDADLQSAAAQLDGAPVLYSHPVYQYLQRRYQLNGVALHWEPDQFPGQQEWSRLQTLLRSHPARLMLWEDEPDQRTAERLADMGIAVVVFRPQGNRPLAGDFADSMRGNIDRLRSEK
jgi:zinc transport system substrate-binding protein